MREQLYVNVPKAFLHPLFFKEKSQIVIENLGELQSFHILEHSYLFLFDLLNIQGIEAYMPWEDKKRSVPLLLDAWEKYKPLLKEWFANRKRREAKPFMIKAIAFFIMAIHWTNKQPVHSLIDWKIELQRLPYQTVNCIERLEYILGAPDHYHSFIQLSELFEELTKQYYLSILKEKNSPRS
ncbi:YpoC family protein [Bacillus pinisoli]|uniref:YpoC family protein n=1 Tax=Bacillus pinisoli TaxID=2901866 RepID=UPI001FF2FC3B|nr:hypothetical protein [Bacillus pinisoli]